MNRSNDKKVEIPTMSKDALSSHWSQKAQEMGCVQIFRSDGSPIIGGVFDASTNQRVKGKNSTHCKLDCCAELRPLSSPPGLAPRTSEFPEKGEPEFTGWQSVEPRSVRRLKTRARYQKQDNSSPSVPYAMTD